MSFDTSVLLDSYFEEIREHLDGITDVLNEFDEKKDSENTISDILRRLHSVKGTSRLMGYTVIEKIAHNLEDVLKGIRDQKYTFTRQLIQLVFLSISLIHHCLHNIESVGNDKLDINIFLKTYKKAALGLPFNVENLGNYLTNTTSEIFELDEAEEIEEVSSLEEIQTIRVKIDDLNTIVNNFDSLIIREFKLKHQIEQLRKEELKTGSTTLHRIRKQLEEDIDLLEQSIFSSQQDILSLRMFPLDVVFTPLKLTIENEAASLSKLVSLKIPSSSLKVDKIILEKLSDVLLHLIRNALDHGIESKEIRKEQGKNETGSISIITKQNENRICISICDDGAGLDYDAIRKTALFRYPERTEEIKKMNKKDLQSFLFISGFSTCEKLTELSGRGVGLDIVRTNLEKIKGQISIHSEKGIGTEFKISIPLTLSTQQGLFIYASGMKLLMPSHYVKEIIQIKQVDIIQLGDQNIIRHKNELIPIYNLSTLLQSKGKKQTSIQNELTLILVSYLDKTTGLIVEKLDYYTSVVVKQLPPMFSHFKALQGVVFDENYSFVPILNIPDTIERTRSLLSYDIKKYETKTKKKAYTILVVDDSYTTRQIEKTILEADNYKVETASDGIEALEKLKSRHYHLVIFDIKMPRMDGFSLATNIRRLENYRNIPLIVVSSLYDEETKKRFSEAGVQKFIVKSDFQRGNLLSSVKDLLHE